MRETQYYTGDLREAQSKRINNLLAQLHQMSRRAKYVLAKVPLLWEPHKIE